MTPNAESPSGGPATAAMRKALLLILSVTFFAHLTGLLSPFHYDDFRIIVENPYITEIKQLWALLSYSIFRPVTSVTYALNRHFSGLNPLSYHAFDLLLHMANTALLFVFAWRFLAVLGRPENERLFISAASSVLFGVHPAPAEAVIYVSSRSSLLCLTSCLAAAVLYLRILAVPKGRRALYPLLFLLILIAGLTREEGLIVPFALAAIGLSVEGTPAGFSYPRSRRLLHLMPFLAFTVLAGIFRVCIYFRMETVEPVEKMYSSLLSQSVIFFKYILHIIVPLPSSFSIIHDIPQYTSIARIEPLLCLAAFVAVAAASFSLYFANRPAFAGALWYLLFLAPSSSIIPLEEAMDDRRLYIPFAGMCILASAAVFRLFGLAAAKSTRVAKSALIALGALPLALSLATIERSRVWMDDVKLWEDALEKYPNSWRVLYALGDAHRREGDFGASIKFYARSFEINPTFHETLINLGISLARVGEIDDAIACFEYAEFLDPNNSRLYLNLGAAYFLMGDVDKSIELFKKAAKLDPSDIDVLINLGRSYATLNMYPEAIAAYEKALLLAPTRDEAAALQDKIYEIRSLGGDTNKP